MSSPPRDHPLILVAASALVVAISCEAGLWLLQLSERDVALIWPAAGVSAGLLIHWGWRVFPGLVLGHIVIWRTLGFGPVTGLVPILYPLEAGLAYLLGYRLAFLRRPDRSAMNRAIWRLVAVPWLAAIPCAILIGWAGISAGRFASEGTTMTLGKIAIAHVHGMVAFGPLTIHVLRGKLRLSGDSLRLATSSLAGAAAAMAALGLMLLAFLDFFHQALGMSSAVYLAFPFVMIAGLALRPPAISCFIALWCTATTLLTRVGTGPFDPGRGDGNPLELGIYNLIICTTAYALSVGSNRFLHQLRQNELTLEAAGVEIWEWDPRKGFHTVRGDRSQDYTLNGSADLRPLDALAWMTGKSAAAPGVFEDQWKVRLEDNIPKGHLLVSSGRILARDGNRGPRKVIGMLQDLSPIRRAEEALIALGQKQAQLRSLQSRLNPHFLFNALNATRAMIHLDPQRASDAITTLAKLLRSNLRNCDNPLIPLSEEMSAVEDLLSIAAMRFGDRLQTEVVIDDDAGSFPVPPMMVFNLVENALIHGIEKQDEPGRLSLHACLRQEQLFVEVRNPGRLVVPLPQGVGIADIRQRIELIYGAGGRFTLSQASSDTVCALLILPFSP
jgi:hypothetical protein